MSASTPQYIYVHVHISILACCVCFSLQLCNFGSWMHLPSYTKNQILRSNVIDALVLGTRDDSMPSCIFLPLISAKSRTAFRPCEPLSPFGLFPVTLCDHSTLSSPAALTSWWPFQLQRFNSLMFCNCFKSLKSYWLFNLLPAGQVSEIFPFPSSYSF